MSIRPDPPMTGPEHGSARGPVLDPAVIELLDHLSREMAHEYVKLTEIAAQSKNETEPKQQQQG